MRSVVWLILLFVAAVVAALTLGDNDGLVTFYWAGWRLDLSLNFFVLAAIGIGLAAVSTVQAVNALLHLPERAREWRALRHERAAHAALREAMTESFSGRYTRAHKAATRALAIRGDAAGIATEHEFQTLARLLAAGSLHRLQDRVRRDELIEELLASPHRPLSPVDEGARLLAAEWALDDRDEARAESLLSELPPGAARRTQALRLKLQVARMSRRPSDALHTARLLAKHQAFSTVAAQGLLRSLAFEVLDTAHDIDQLRRAWQQLDPADRLDPFVASRASRRATAMGANSDARQWLLPLWERLAEVGAEGRAQLALALADAASGIGAEWLPRVEAAQRAHPVDGPVQAAAGAVLMACQLWGKARRPLELAAQDTALDARARRQAWRRLADLAREEGDVERAATCDRAAAAID
ncbi:heme biosynthesis HemY N-terminal domain-containing protein [Ideonella sp. A 288]|uniref:heme biosynthesis HemY N-terminal domain-containing protein n=1 Tax=Ideonella sp. A 288 TaxID=1962181 RepID=UPI000B4B7985|nr:heme biosynthesis HemY N-terminal domain-containing protein [Ideonella sp. A 288]